LKPSDIPAIAARAAAAFPAWAVRRVREMSYDNAEDYLIRT
jgi:hypothetical protein